MFINQRDKYIGLHNTNNQGYEMEVIDYLNYDHATIRFLPPYTGTVITKICHFLDGCIHNPFAPSVNGYGITGTKYLTHDKNGKHLIEYLIWQNMLRRTVNVDLKKNPTYENVICDPEWQYYENFYEWMNKQENFEQLEEQKDVNLDKDILIKNNKEYGPEKCVLVPRIINNLILRSNSIRGNYPIGVHYQERNNKYIAQEGGHQNHTYLGIYDTIEEAFNVYKQYKENRIQTIAKEEYDKGNITKRCYEALLNYRVEITD